MKLVYKSSSGVRLRLVAEIAVAPEVRPAFLRDFIVLSLTRDRFDQFRILKLRDSPVQSRVGDIYISVVEIVCDSLFVMGRPAILQELQYHIITGCHPLSAEPRHDFLGEEPRYTIFDLFYVGPFLLHSGLL